MTHFESDVFHDSSTFIDFNLFKGLEIPMDV